MASYSVVVGRFISLGLLIVQAVLLMLFPIEYESTYYWPAVGILALSYFLAFVFGVWYACGRSVRSVWWVWLFNAFTLVARTGVIFSRARNELSEENLLGQRVLKISMCISPVVLHFLLNVATDSNKHRKLVSLLSCRITLDVFDGIEMLGVILDDGHENNPDIPPAVEIVIMVSVCLAFLLSPFELRKHKVKDDDDDCCESREDSSLIHTIVHLVVNFSFLVLRMVLWTYFKREASIFIAKSGLSIMVSIPEIWHRCC